MAVDRDVSVEPIAMNARDAILALKARMAESIIGQEAMVERLILGLIANGHLLVEGLPGLAKTRAIKSLAKNLDAQLSRIQFTPDLLPSDITGSDIYYTEAGKGEFRFQQGPIFANLVLADEVNRAPAKVQAALLEAMEERQVTVAGTTRKLPDLFLVMATQNPIEQEGTYPLPEAQMERFLMHVAVGYPDERSEGAIVLLNRDEEAAKDKRVSSAAAPKLAQDVILQARSEVHEINVSAGPRTALGDSIGLGVKMFKQSKAPDKLLVLLTDGNDTASRMPPDRAADIAKQEGITIHTVGIGDPQATGEDKVDVDTLQKVAATTGGRYFFGQDQTQLEQIYATLDRITPSNQKTLSWRPVHELFYVPLGAAQTLLFAYSAAMFLSTAIRRRRTLRAATEAHV